MSYSSVFAGLCLILSASFVGLWIKKRMFLKAAFYEDYYSYLLFATEKISYERMPVGELIAAFTKGNQREFSRFLKGEKTVVPLSENATRDICEYLNGIGKTDAETQIASLKGKAAEVKRFVETECVKYRKDGNLYFKLSVLVGAVLFIIFV